MMIRDGDTLIQKLWSKALQVRGLEAILFWQKYSIEHDSWQDWDCPN